MALVTVQRSPSSNNSPTSIDGSSGTQNDMDNNRNPKSLSECYFAGKGTALVLPAEAQKSSRRSSSQGSNIQKHLQSMFYLLRQEETLKMAVKLESVHPVRTRYLVVVSRAGQRGEESCLLGIDCNEKTTVGLVLRVLADTTIRLDGDGGFSVSVCNQHHIFKPVSVQAMWSALQTLHKVSSKARDQNYFQGGQTHDWVSYYESKIHSDRSCLNEWHAMDNLESRRPPSPDSIRTKPTERQQAENIIRATLKEIMMSVDLDEVTSKYIRTRLEEDMNMDLGEYKSFIDQEMLTILGQMDAPTEVFDHVYLGSEWNASNYEELQRNGVGHILNVTREIDNFFPGSFDYFNIRVYDDEKTDLLKHWDDTFKYITKAKNRGSKVLVHCKMGISRSASVVIAYAMKACNWDFKTAMHHVKEKRSCIKPNSSFLSQLETYQGILDAMKNKEKLQRSKSETNLKSNNGKSEKVLVGSEPTPVVQALSKTNNLQTTLSGQDLRHLGKRPKSWSPDNQATSELVSSEKTSPVFLSLEDLSQKSTSKESIRGLHQTSDLRSPLGRHVLLPCHNGESYSVSANQIMHLPGQHHDSPTASVKYRVSAFESSAEDSSERKKSSSSSRSQEGTPDSNSEPAQGRCEQTDSKSPSLPRSVLLNMEWDPGEKDKECEVSYRNSTSNVCDLKTDSVSDCQTVWTSSTVVKTIPEIVKPISNNLAKVSESQQTNRTRPVVVTRKDGDPFSHSVDKVFDCEEKYQQRMSLSAIPMSVSELSKDNPARECPSRQHSWSSYDSAIVMGSQNETHSDVLSRHSSWGSGDTRTLPSRNSSWGSYDLSSRGSLHFVNEKGEKVVQSTSSEIDRFGSSGIFPYDKEDIPWHPGTVKRTKLKLEENSTKLDDQINESSNPTNQSSEALLCENAISQQKTLTEATDIVLSTSSKESSTCSNTSAISNIVDIPQSEANINYTTRLSVSAPESSHLQVLSEECSLSRSASNVSNLAKPQIQTEVVNTAKCSSVKEHKTFIESLHKRPVRSKKSTANAKSNISGIVKNLKMEFEAKTSTNNEQSCGTSETVDMSRNKNQVSSLPSSPVSIHHQRERRDSNKAADDLSVKILKGRFENSRQDNHVNHRTKCASKPFRNTNMRHSCIEVSVEKTPIQTPLITSLHKNSTIMDSSSGKEMMRPPVVPNVRHSSPGRVVAATVIAKAAKKQQQYGRSHPLALLNVNPRHNNPVYNTM